MTVERTEKQKAFIATIAAQVAAEDGFGLGKLWLYAFPIAVSAGIIGVSFYGAPVWVGNLTVAASTLNAIVLAFVFIVGFGLVAGAKQKLTLLASGKELNDKQRETVASMDQSGYNASEKKPTVVGRVYRCVYFGFMVVLAASAWWYTLAAYILLLVAYVFLREGMKEYWKLRLSGLETDVRQPYGYEV